jgi:hypothetical protein
MSIKIQGTVVIDDTRNFTNANSIVVTGSSSLKLPVGTSAQRPSGIPGMIRYNTDLSSIEGYISDWGSIGGGSSLTPVVVSSNTTMVSGSLYILTANVGITLPASPTASDSLSIVNKSGYSNSVVLRNSQNIMGLAEDMTIDDANANFQMVFANTGIGWIII